GLRRRAGRVGPVRVVHSGQLDEWLLPGCWRSRGGGCSSCTGSLMDLWVWPGNYPMLCAGPCGLRYRRGFADRLEGRLGEFWTHAGRLFARHPVLELAVIDRRPRQVAGGWEWEAFRGWRRRQLPDVGPTAYLPVEWFGGCSGSHYYASEEEA